MADAFKSFGEIAKPRILDKEKGCIAFVTFKEAADCDQFFSKKVRSLVPVALELVPSLPLKKARSSVGAKWFRLDDETFGLPSPTIDASTPPAINKVQTKVNHTHPR